MGAMTVAVGDIRIHIGIVIGKGNLSIDVYTCCRSFGSVLFGESAAFGAGAVSIGKRLVRHAQTGVEHRDDSAAAVVARIDRIVVSGH